MNASVAATTGMPPEGPGPLIGIVEDDPIMGESLVQRLHLEGYGTCWWQSGEEALRHLRDASCHVLVCDIRLPDLNGEQLFRRALPDLGTNAGDIHHRVRRGRASGTADAGRRGRLHDQAVRSRCVAAQDRRSSAPGSSTAGNDIPRTADVERIARDAPRCKLELLRVEDKPARCCCWARPAWARKSRRASSMMHPYARSCRSSL